MIDTVFRGSYYFYGKCKSSPTKNVTNSSLYIHACTCRLFNYTLYTYTTYIYI